MKEQGRTNRNFKKKKHNRQRKTERDAKRALESGSVIVLVEDDIPPGAIALLGKGLGFVPTPTLDKLNLRLDMKLLTNKILNQSNRNLSNSSITSNDEDNNNDISIPKKLRKNNYSNVNPSGENIVNETVERMKSELDQNLQKKVTKEKSNLTSDEALGLKWLQEKVSDGSIAITKADKGGATLIVKPDLLRKKAYEKMKDETLYEKLASDPTKDLHKTLLDLWVEGKSKSFVSAYTAKNIMGISDNESSKGTGPTNCQSTLPHFKPENLISIHVLKFTK